MNKGVEKAISALETAIVLAIGWESDADANVYFEMGQDLDEFTAKYTELLAKEKPACGDATPTDGPQKLYM